jgi:hypothetical protein
MTLVSMLLAVFTAPRPVDVLVTTPGIVAFMGACGAVVGGTGVFLRSTKLAAVVGALIACFPFAIYLILALVGAPKLDPARMTSLAISTGVLGAVTSVLARRFAHIAVNEQNVSFRKPAKRPQFSVSTLLLAALFAAALLGFVRALFWNLGIAE